MNSDRRLAAPSHCDDAHSPADLAAKFLSVRAATRKLCEPLEVEDFCIQSMLDTSPTKWHLAHTSWFFETFVLMREVPNYRPVHPDYAVLFNSYYNTIGEQHARPARGLLSRPTAGEVMEYRDNIDDGIGEFVSSIGDPESSRQVLSVMRRRRCARRVQRQVHVQSDGAPRGIVWNAPVPHPSDVSKLLSARSALALQRHPLDQRVRLATVAESPGMAAIFDLTRQSREAKPIGP